MTTFEPRIAGKVPGTPAGPGHDIRALYLHIPFCERKCEYCDFTSVAGTDGSEEYMAALRTEVARLGAQLPGLTLDTVFIGGGTPSLVAPDDIARLLDDVRRSFSIAVDAEVTMEANPSSISIERARTWVAAGISRVSIGVQSLHAPTLAYLGRVHDAGRALAAVAEVRAAGAAAVSCDLIYGVPGLDDAMWRDTLQRVIATNPDHISCYELTVEPGTPLHTRVRRGLTAPVGDETALEQHAIAVAELEGAGYRQYEVSNFARTGRRCRHNLAYWHNRHYLAAGVGAHGHLPAGAAAALGIQAVEDAVGVRYWHGRGIRAYTASVGAGLLPLAGWEGVSAAAREEERLMLGLRLTDGIRMDPGPGLAELESAGLLVARGGTVRVTRRGEALLNAVVARLTEPETAVAAC